MKHLFFCVAFIAHNLFAQAPVLVSLCDNAVSTDWQSPTNNNLPLWDHDNNVNTPMIADIRFLNGFDWVNPNTYPTSNLFFTESQSYGNMLNVKPTDNPVEWYQYLFFGEKMSPKNGWEILLVNLGRYPNNVAVHSDESFKFTPYIVLYNRYQGIIRVFVTYGRNQLPVGAVDGVKIDLSFLINSSVPIGEGNNNLSGLLRPTENLDRALDKGTTVRKMTALAKNPGFENRWYSADFQVALDPCTCNYPSQLNLNFSFFSQTNIVLEGRSIEQTTDLVNAQEQLIDQNFLGSFDLSDNENADGGFAIYKSLGGAIDEYIQQMADYETQLATTNAYNKDIKRNKAIAKAFKAVILSGGSATGVGAAGVAIFVAAGGGAEWATDFIENASDLIEKDTVPFVKIKEETKKLLGSQFDFFIERNFKEKPTPTEPTMPTVSFSQMNFKGRLEDRLELSGPNFNNPGSFKNTEQIGAFPSVYQYPVYNDVLGTFALLETPKVKLAEVIKNPSTVQAFHKWNQPADAFGYHYGRNYLYQFWTKLYQIQLLSDLKYTFNGNLDINIANIQAAFVVNLVPKFRDITGTLATLNAFHDPLYTTNLHSDLKDENANYILTTKYGGYQNGINYIGSAIPNNELYPAINNISSLEKVKYETNFYPIDAFKNVVSEVGIKNEYNFAQKVKWGEEDINGNIVENSVVPIPAINPGVSGKEYKYEIEISLKLMVDFEYATLNEDGLPNKVTQIYIYLLETPATPQTSEIVNNLSSTSSNYDKYPENLNLSDKVFNGVQVDGCVLNGTVYTCQAINNINIEGSLLSIGGYSVNIIAGNSIIESPEATITGEINRFIQPVLDFSNPQPPVDVNYLSSFCDKTNANSPYQANAAGKNFVFNQSELNNSESDVAIENSNSFNFTLFPNPTKNRTTVRVESSEELPVSIDVFDITGKKIDFVLNSNAKNEYTIDLSNNTNGIYFVKIACALGSQTKQLIIQ